MIDVAALMGLFFEASKEWRDPKNARIDVNDADDEEIVKKTKRPAALSNYRHTSSYF
jgi:hypothetical protein